MNSVTKHMGALSLEINPAPRLVSSSSVDCRGLRTPRLYHYVLDCISVLVDVNFSSRCSNQKKRVGGYNASKTCESIRSSPSMADF